MLTFESFTGINNVQQEHRLSGSDLIDAVNVCIGLTGEVTRRGGFVLTDPGCHKNLHQGASFMLATTGDQLVAMHPGGARHVIHPALGPERVWYCDLPDGRTTFSNGLIHGVTDGLTGAERSVPTPPTLGSAGQVLGALHPGHYRYHLTYMRLTDRLESPAVSSAPVALEQGGLRLDNLPQLDGHAINVYLSGQDGEGAYLAGTTTERSFEYVDNNAALVLPCRTLEAEPFPVGTITAYWRGRVLVAQGNLLWASRPSALHLSDWRDFKQLAGQITAIQPVDDGVYVGTDQDLVFLGGATWDELAYQPTRRGPVVRGSGVAVRGDRLKLGDGAGTGMAMVCIAGGEVVGGFNGGQTFSLTANRYRSAVQEVRATWREVNGIPQYLAVPQ